jgi:ABC-2 type transport system ATP-binding protein
VVQVISVEHLTKRYGSSLALDDVSFGVDAGEVVGVLGPNGAGKTTTIEILEGFRLPTAGSVRVLGRPPAAGGRRLKNRVGIVLQSAGSDSTLTVREAVGLYATFYRPRRPPGEVIAEVMLEGTERTRIGQLSGGQRRRLDLALALVGHPEVLFLDEPTTGLDPAARRRIWEVIGRLRARGVAVVLTSHYLDEVQRLADRVVVLRRGQVIAEGPPGQLGGPGATSISFRLDSRATLPSGPWELRARGGGSTTLSTAVPTEALRILANWAASEGFELEELEVRRPSLEEAYLELTAKR